MIGVKYYKRSMGASRSSRSIIHPMIRFALLVACMCAVASSMELKHFFVPDPVNLKSPDPITLECDIEIKNDERRQIVIQWKLNDTLLYLWTENRTTGLPYVNSLYLDEVTKNRPVIRNQVIHAPLVISKKYMNHTGLYVCSWSTDVIHENSDQDYMRMYVPVDNITLDQVYDNGTNELNVTCGTEDVYPKPEVKLSINDQPTVVLKAEPILNVQQKENQLFDISATYMLSISHLKSSSKINCSIILPDVDQVASRLTQFNRSGNDTDDTIIITADTDANESSTNSLADSSAPAPSWMASSYLLSMSVLVLMVFRFAGTQFT